MTEREREVKLLAVSREQLDSLGRRPSLGGYPLAGGGEARQEDAYLETADYRLFRAGLSLRYREKEGRFTAALKEVLPLTKRPLLRDRLELEEDAGTEMPDLSAPPGGEIGRRIAPLLGTRALTPLVRIRTHRRKFRLVPPAPDAPPQEGAGSDVGGAVLCLDAAQVLPGNGGNPVGSFFEVELEDLGIGGKPLETIGGELLQSYGLLPSSLSKFERGLAVLGLLADVRGEDREFETTVRPTDRLVDAGYRVFRKHFERMKANEPGTRIGADIEFLHDMRVSTRRIRAAFRTFRPAFKKERLAGFNRDLKHIAAVLGAVRDLDVYQERFPEYTESLSDEDRGSLELYRDHLRAQWRRSRVQMLRMLETKRYAAFLVRFERFLARGAPKRPALPSARMPVTEAAPLIIRKALKRVLKKGRPIPPKAPPAQDLHDLRILCKRLRYTCEFFSDLYGKPMKRFVKSVVRFQDLLGAHQDACVAGDTLRRFASGVKGSRQDLVKTALVLGQLVAAQDRAAAEARTHFREAWKEFDRKDIRRKMWG
jgi:CHAD domain-containing protein